jgi:hypothetical protein
MFITLFVPDLKETMTEDIKEHFYKNKNIGECTEGDVLYTWSDEWEQNGWAWSSEAPMHLLFLGRQVAKINRRGAS